MNRRNKALLAGIAAVGAYLVAVKPNRRKEESGIPDVYYAHRGLHDNSSDAPENSLRAFQKAVDRGYGIELDVQMTKDGQVVVVHDFDLKRIAGIDRKVDSYTYAELREIPIYGSDQHIPLFTEVLRLVDGKVPLIVELKYKNKSACVCEHAQEILDAYHGTYVVESFHPQVLIWYRKNRPNIVRGQLSMNYQRDDHLHGIHFWGMRHLLTNFLTKPDFIAYDHRAAKSVSKNICRKLFGCPSVAWTIKSQEEMDHNRRYYDYFIFEGFIPY